MIYNEETIKNLIEGYTLPNLHIDLQPYLYGDELCHPLLTLEGGVHPRLYPRINKLYLHRKTQQSESVILNEWQTYFPHHTNYDRLTKFIKLETGRADFPRPYPEYYRTIGQIWTDIELLAQTSSFLELMLGIDSGKPLSNLTCHIMTSTEQRKYAEIPNEFIVFRGHDRRLLKGVSWTMDCNVALQYAVGCPTKAAISVGKVNKSEVIAFIDRWEENEIIVPSSAVENINTYTARNYIDIIDISDNNDRDRLLSKQ